MLSLPKLGRKELTFPISEAEENGTISIFVSFISVSTSPSPQAEDVDAKIWSLCCLFSATIAHVNFASVEFAIKIIYIFKVIR